MGDTPDNQDVCKLIYIYISEMLHESDITEPRAESKGTLAHGWLPWKTLCCNRLHASASASQTGLKTSLAPLNNKSEHRQNKVKAATGTQLPNPKQSNNHQHQSKLLLRLSIKQLYLKHQHNLPVPVQVLMRYAMHKQRRTKSIHPCRSKPSTSKAR